jgi:hypothetical protein
MTRYSDTDALSQAGDRLFGAARRHPEALLLFAAGCCLLMRSGSSTSRAASHTRYDDTGHEHRADFSRAFPKPASSSVREGFSRAADTATEYASEIKDRVSDAASSYTEAVSDFAQDAGRNISEHSARLTRQAHSTLESSMNRVLREQPLAVVMAGLAAGAAVAAVFPSTEIEDRTLGSAGEGLRQAAGKATEKVKDAAGKASERFKSAAEERGLTSEGIKELAGEVADTFTDAVSGKPDDPDRATTKAPQSGTAATGAGQSFGAGQLGRAANRSSDQTRPDLGSRQGNR